MHYPALPAGAFIAAFLILIPAFWHWPTRHVPTLSLIAWLFITNVIYGANSLAWSDGVQDKAPIWCDICESSVSKVTGTAPTALTAGKCIIGASMALPACNLRISKHLALIGGKRNVGLDRRDRGRIAMFDFGFCWGVPVIFMALRKSSVLSSPTMAEGLFHILDYIVQGHRYNVVQYIGCQPATYVSIPGIFIVWVPPLILSVGSSVYAGT